MATRRDEYPTPLNGGEPQDKSDRRIGETRRQSPEAGEVDPATGERDLERRGVIQPTEREPDDSARRRP